MIATHGIVGWTALLRELRTLTHAATPSGMAPRLAFLQSCTPGYYNFEGANRRFAELNELYGPGPMPYYGRLEAWRDEGELRGLELTYAAKSAKTPA